MRSIFKCAFVIFIVTSASFQFLATDRVEIVAAHETFMGRKGMISAAHYLGAQAGLRILREGGNAVDAAVATAAALNVVEPMMSGLAGGGGQMLVYLAKTNEVISLDFTGTAPYAATSDVTWYQRNEGMKSSLVPASLAGWNEMLTKYGTMGLKQVFQPAIEIAEEGVPVSYKTASMLERFAYKLSMFASSTKVFFPDGKSLKAGDLLVQKDLANTYRRIAAEGPQVFYTGEIGKKIAQFSRDNGGLISEKDLADYRPKWRRPARTTYRGYEIIASPPGSFGTTVLQVLNILEGYSFRRGFEHNSAEYIHRVVEAVKLAYADDDKYNSGKEDLNSKYPYERLLSKHYAERQRARIDPDRAAPATLPAGDGHTTHFVVADKYGNAVTLTQTLCLLFGNGAVVEGTGILLNDCMMVFDPKATDVNNLEGGIRPRLVMTPVMVLKNGKPYIAIGASGAYTIPQTVPQVLINIIDYEMDVQKAIEASRFALNAFEVVPPTTTDTVLHVEPGISQDAIQALTVKGHRVSVRGGIGAVQAIMIHPETGVLMGGADPRRDGYALGW